VQVIDWPQIVDYISSRDPTLVTSFRGVPQADIDLCERRFSVKLPASYVDFLLRMGEDSGALRPLGATQSHRFSELMADFPPEGYPAGRLFNVSFETDPSALVVMGTFLDMADVDANDARLVEFEPGDEDTPITPGDFTFGEFVVQEIFTGLELYLTRYAATVLLHSQSTDDGLGRAAAAGALLGRLGFTLVMPDLPRVSCWRRDTISVMVAAYRNLQTVHVGIGCNRFSEIEAFAAEVTASLPGAILLQAPFEQRE
jgi:hypothetical protein